MTTKPSPSMLENVNWTFSTVAEMQASTKLRDGDLVRTFGYRAVGDGGGADYRVTVASGASNTGSKLALSNAGLQAVLQDGWRSNPLMFGAYGDATTNDQAALQAWIDYMFALRPVTGPMGAKVHLDFLGREYAIASGISFPDTADGAVISNLSLKAIGSWAATRDTAYMVTNYAGYSDFFSCSLNGNNVANGWKDAEGSGRARYYSLQIAHPALVGYWKAAGAGETRMFGANMWQFLTSDAEFATQSNFTATLLRIDESDCKFHDSNFRWAGTCVEYSTGVQLFYGCHFVQGTAGAYARTNGRHFYVPNTTGELFTYDCYFDNGYSEFYTDKVNIGGMCVFDPADADVGVMFRFYAYQSSTPECRATMAVTFNQWDETATLVDWLDDGANVWADDYSRIVSRLAGVLADGGHVARVVNLNNIAENLATNANGAAQAITSNNIRSYITFLDVNSASGGADFGSQGDDARIAATGYLRVDTQGIRYSNGVLSLSGNGTPEGAVTAPVGSDYRRLDGGASTSYYVKESGSGNTGWVAK